MPVWRTNKLENPMKHIIFCRMLKNFLPLLVLLFVLSCSGGSGELGVTEPASSSSSGNSSDFSSSKEVEIGIQLQAKEGQSPEMPNVTLLADANDGTTTDNTNLYIDVAISNLGDDPLFTPDQAESLVLEASVDFIDIPYQKNFSYGELKLVIGWTDGGLQASEVEKWEFDTDNTLTFSMPLTRTDSFHVADNVAVYGVELAEDRFIHASVVQKLESGAAAPTDSPAMVGYVQRIDTDKERLYVSGATIVFSNTTQVLDTNGELIAMDKLQDGANELTITGLAWGYADFLGMIANGWEFRSFNIYVAVPIE